METELAVPKTEDDEGRTRVEAVERSLSLLQCFRHPGEALSLAVLAQRSSLYKSTILRLTPSLVYMKFLERDAAGQEPSRTRGGRLQEPCHAPRRHRLLRATAAREPVPITHHN